MDTDTTQRTQQRIEDGAHCRLWRSYRGRTEPLFTTTTASDCAELLDRAGVEWEFEPITFVLETDADGRVIEAFQPDFYLPESNLFLVVTSAHDELGSAANRRVRKLRQRYPDVNVRLVHRRDVEGLGRKLASRAASTTTVDQLLAG